MTDQEHVQKLAELLPTLNGQSVTITVENWNVVYSTGNGSVGIPLPDGEPTPTVE